MDTDPINTFLDSRAELFSARADAGRAARVTIISHRIFTFFSLPGRSASQTAHGRLSSRGAAGVSNETPEPKFNVVTFAIMPPGRAVVRDPQPAAHPAQAEARG